MNFRKTSSLLFIFAVGILSLTLVDCSNSSSSNDNINDDPPGEIGPGEVGMRSISFTPGNIEIVVGETVTWKNNSELTHTVTSGPPGEHDGMFNSGNLSPGQEFSFTFEETGTFEYYCIPHLSSNMIGTVTVIAGN